MARIVYVNGSFVQQEEAKISVFDRGFLFADGVYEVTTVLGGRLVDFDSHLARLSRSLAELEIEMEVDRQEMLALHRSLVARNRLDEGLVYLQVTRGVAERDFSYPAEATPTLVLFTQHKPLCGEVAGQKVVSVVDQRWHRRDIKTVQLLAASMAKMEAHRAGKDDAWLVEDGLVTEGTSNNAYIVTGGGVIVTRQLSTALLPGVTRAAVLRLAREQQLAIEERPFTISEAQQAVEAFVTSATAFVTPVVEIDGVAVGDGRPGPLVGRLRQMYIEECGRSAI